MAGTVRPTIKVGGTTIPYTPPAPKSPANQFIRLAGGEQVPNPNYVGAPAPEGWIRWTPETHKFLAGIAAGQAAAAGMPEDGGDYGGDGGGGGWDGGGGGGGGYGPDPALLAALAQLDGFQQQGMDQINGAESQWRERLGQLRASTAADLQRVGGTIQQDASTAKAQYGQSISPILADLAAQGFSSSGIQQQASMDTAHMDDYARRQGDLNSRFAQLQSESFGERDATATGQMSAARGVLANNIAAARAELTAQLSGGGGGGGGGYGGGGGSSSLPASILSALADANTPLADIRDGVSYGGRNQSVVNRFINSVNADGSNLGKQWREFKVGARANGLTGGGWLKGVKKNVYRPLKKNNASNNKARRTQAKSSELVRLYGS